MAQSGNNDNMQLNDWQLKSRRLDMPFSITANATPSLKTSLVGTPSVMTLSLQGQTATAQALDPNCNFSPAANDSTGTFGVLLYGLGGRDEGVAQLFRITAGPIVSPAAPAGSPNLGSASTYAVLAGSTITNTGSTVITGNVGLYPGTSVTGFPPGVINGTENVANGAAANAQIAATAAYTDLSTRSATVIPSALDGQTLTPGVYKFTSGAASLAASGNGTLTLNGAGVYVIQTASTLTTGAGGTPTIAFTGGATAANLYFAVGSSATLNVSGTGTFEGTLIAQSSITVDGGASNGQLLALTGAVTISAATTMQLALSGGSAPWVIVLDGQASSGITVSTIMPGVYPPNAPLASGENIAFTVITGVNLSTTNLSGTVTADYLLVQ